MGALLSILNEFLYSYILIALLLVAGLYFTFRTRFVQFRLFKEGIQLLSEKSHKQGGVSSFQALMISTASRVGTGNIAGVATALAAGGAGSIFWMWIIALIGAASAFIESTLAQVYKNKDGEQYRGGPAYYMQKALGKRWLGVIFAVLLIACFCFGFNPLQAYNVSSAVAYYFDNEQLVALIIGIILAVLSAFVIFGGVHRIGIISSTVVPVMAVLYILLGVYITFINIDKLPVLFHDIFSAAFDFKAISGGFAGSCVMHGIKRGLFSNEAGMGSSPLSYASVEDANPVEQGFWGIFEVFFDTLVVLLSGFVLLSSPVYGSGTEGVDLLVACFRDGFGNAGGILFAISLLFFAFPSILGWYYYASVCISYVSKGDFLLKIYRFVFLFLLMFGGMLDVGFVWGLADVFNALMAFPNLISLVLLYKIVVKLTKEYMEKTGK